MAFYPFVIFGSIRQSFQTSSIPLFFSRNEIESSLSFYGEGGIDHAWSSRVEMEASRRSGNRSVCRGGEIVIYKEEVTGMIVFRRGSQTFRLPFSGWLALAILWIFFTGAPTPGGCIYSGSFVPREPPRHSGQGGHLFLPFFLFFTRRYLEGLRC